MTHVSLVLGLSSAIPSMSSILAGVRGISYALYLPLALRIYLQGPDCLHFFHLRLDYILGENALCWYWLLICALQFWVIGNYTRFAFRLWSGKEKGFATTWTIKPAVHSGLVLIL